MKPEDTDPLPASAQNVIKKLARRIEKYILALEDGDELVLTETGKAAQAKIANNLQNATTAGVIKSILKAKRQGYIKNYIDSAFKTLYRDRIEGFINRLGLKPEQKIKLLKDIKNNALFDLDKISEKDLLIVFQDKRR